MPGKRITSQQENLYMSSRDLGYSQEISAAKAGISERSGRTIEQGKGRQNKPRTWRTRSDPFSEVWDSELVPLLTSMPDISPITLLDYLQRKYEGKYPDNKLRTLERRVKKWKAVYGEKREVMFSQEHVPGRQGISDFTQLKEVTITINQSPFKHLLYHFRLSFSGWSHVKVIQGGESFTALAEGLQEALWRLGGVPFEHRTDSLSAAFKNLRDDEKADITTRYSALCKHYGMESTRNNRGLGHENGSIESPHGHIKRRIKQSLLLRGNNDFESVQSYQNWLDEIINQHNRRNAKGLSIERNSLQALPMKKTIDFVEVCARVSSSSTIDVRKCTYTVPSRLIGESLRIHLYHDRLECYLGSTHIIDLSRVYPLGATTRARNIDYRHVIHSLAKKPQAFRYSRLRDDLLPNNKYKQIWAYINKNIPGKPACRLMVGLLELAANYDCEQSLANDVLLKISQGQSLSLTTFQHRYGKALNTPPDITVEQHTLATYNDLINSIHHEEVYCG